MKKSVYGFICLGLLVFFTGYRPGIGVVNACPTGGARSGNLVRFRHAMDGKTPRPPLQDR